MGLYPQDIYIKGYDGIAGSQRERDAIAELRAAGYKDMLKNEGDHLVELSPAQIQEN